jgi:hypothetical protein
MRQQPRPPQPTRRQAQDEQLSDSQEGRQVEPKASTSASYTYLNSIESRLIFHPLLHHYTAPNRSALRRWALQFHYHQTGMEWTDLEAHRQQYHDETGGYAGCTVPKSALESGRQTPWPDGRKMAVVPVDDWD